MVTEDRFGYAFWCVCSTTYLVNIAEIILASGKDCAPALFHGQNVTTYGELREQVAKVASELQARGHSEGDRIGLWSENSPFFVSTYLGTMHAGMAVVPFQTETSRPIFERIVADAGINELFVSQKFLARVRPWANKCGVTLVAETPPALNCAGTPARQTDSSSSRLESDQGASRLASLMFTSGSTGAPKGVMVSHRNIECNCRDIISYVGLTSADRVMLVLPLHYCFALSLLHTHLMAGASLVLNNNFKLYPEIVLKEMQQRGCTGLAGVPSTFQILLYKSRFRTLDLPKLRWFQQAGGKLPDTSIRELSAAFPYARFFLMYGQTEATARLSYLPPDRLADKLGSIGKGLPSTKLEVLKADGTPVLPGSSETGEIVASGDNIAHGYWNDPIETARFFRNHRLYTGDIARVDADGFIFIVGRERGIIKSGGNRVSAEEVEEVIAEIPGVVEVAVVGLPHELLGESIEAFIVASFDVPLSPEDIMRHCSRRLPAFKVPGNVTLLPNMPHHSSGKTLKTWLKEVATHRRVEPAPVA